MKESTQRLLGTIRLSLWGFLGVSSADATILEAKLLNVEKRHRFHFDNKQAHLLVPEQAVNVPNVRNVIKTKPEVKKRVIERYELLGEVKLANVLRVVVPAVSHGKSPGG
jgi:hypothetical protein